MTDEDTRQTVTGGGFISWFGQQPSLSTGCGGLVSSPLDEMYPPQKKKKKREKKVPSAGSIITSGIDFA